MRLRCCQQGRDKALQQIEEDRRNGRRASSDEVATCLLQRNLPAAVSVRRVDKVARARRRIRLLAGTLVIWWLIGKALFVA